VACCAARARNEPVPLGRTREKTIQAILRHANVSTTNTYYIKSAADDTRVAMAKLEKLVSGNEQPETFESGSEVATTPADATTALIQ